MQRFPSIDSIDPQQAEVATRWLKLGVLALALAGLFAILLVLSRAPGSSAILPWIDFFRTALVIHVNQSVLIWFLSMAAVVWTLALPTHPGIGSRLCHLGAVTGCIGIALSAFIGDGTALINNYVPVLQRPLFYAMLGLFGLAILLRTLRFLSRLRWQRLLSDSALLEVAAFTVALPVVAAVFALVTAWLTIPPMNLDAGYFEFLFWGAGHTLQFAYAQLMLLAWLLLAGASAVQLPVSNRALRWILLAGILPVLAVPLISTLYPANGLQLRVAFTRLMQFGGGIATLPIGLLLIIGLSRAPAAAGAQRPLRIALWMSIALFGAGGVIGLSITDSNTVIPAHYHGAIVAVTLALMGMAYLLLPRLGYTAVSGRLASVQPLLYGIGQLLHISGLALSGALGMQRKTAGTAQGLDSLAVKLTMGIMGIGGLLAVIGGILFVWLMLRAFWRGRRRCC